MPPKKKKAPAKKAGKASPPDSSVGKATSNLGGSVMNALGAG